MNKYEETMKLANALVDSAHKNKFIQEDKWDNLFEDKWDNLFEFIFQHFPRPTSYIEYQDTDEDKDELERVSALPDFINEREQVKSVFLVNDLFDILSNHPEQFSDVAFPVAVATYLLKTHDLDFGVFTKTFSEFHNRYHALIYNSMC